MSKRTAETSGRAGARPEKKGRRGILLILLGIVVSGAVAGYRWWRELPR